MAAATRHIQWLRFASNLSSSMTVEFSDQSALANCRWISLWLGSGVHAKRVLKVVEWHSETS